LDAGYGVAQQARRVLRKYALRNVARFFVSTPEERNYLSEICGLDKVSMAPLPVDLTQFHRIERNRARTKLGWRAEDNYILYVGRLEERKGLEYLLQATRMLVSSFPRLHLVVVGSGSLSHKDTNNTIFMGQVRYSDLPLYYNAADLCILPSLRESWARVVVESLACQVPVIGTWTGCVPTLVKDGVKGLFVVPMRESVALADKISEIIPNSEELRFKIDRRKLENYGSDNFVRQMVLNYRELAEQHA
jgi:glycosyltransferase involved in cell wall biosynthesis